MPENLIRLKQLNQAEITGLVQNVISSNSYALTQNGGTGLNIGNIGGINLNNLSINISGSRVNFQNNDINLAYQFPPSTGIKRHLPLGFQSMTTTFPSSGFITYHPFLIRKKIPKLNLCVELTSYLNDTTIKLGIYSGNNGYEGAKLFWSGSIFFGSLYSGIKSTTANVALDEGPYIIASCNTGTATAAASAFKVMNANFNRQIFGENTGYNTFGNSVNSAATTYAYYDTGLDLYSSIRSGFMVGSSAFQGPLVGIEY
jgi:hypothetical protein